MVNVSGVSPGPERRVSDRRTMAAGSIQKHSCCDRMPGSVFCFNHQAALVKAALNTYTLMEKCMAGAHGNTHNSASGHTR